MDDKVLLTKEEFFKKVFKMIKLDNSYYNVITQIIEDHDLNASEVGEWVKEDKAMVEYIANELSLYKKKRLSVHDLV